MSRFRGSALRAACLSMAVLLSYSVLAAAWPGTSAAVTSIMGPSALTADELAGWYRSTGMQPHPELGVSIAALAGYFISEGRAEGVRGDIAFAQSVLETGYFSFPASGQVRPQHHNYAGIGAVDGGSNPSQFPSPRIGVRAQIQHLRAYADPTVTESKLSNPLVDPRFGLVTKGSAPNWEDLGGRWASDTQYGTKILAIYSRISAWADLVRTATPITGDWNGDGRATPGWFKDGLVLLRNANSSGGSDIVFRYGRAGDEPVVGDWDGNRTDTIGVRRGATWYLRNRNSGGPAQLSFSYGRASDEPVIGDWDGNRTETVGIVRGTTWYLRDANSGGAANRVFDYQG